MRTFFSMAALIILGSVVRALFPLILYVLNLPGRWIALPNTSGKSSGKSWLISGTLVTILLQAYTYLAYAAFIAVWTTLAVQKQGNSGIIFLAAFFAVIFPVGAVSKNARMKAEEAKRLYRGRFSKSEQYKANEHEKALNMADWASSITFVLSLAGFVVFAFFPKFAEIVYSWIPFKELH